MKDAKEKRSFWRRLVAVTVVVALVFLVFLWRLGQFQLGEGGRYGEDFTSSSSTPSGSPASAPSSPPLEAPGTSLP